MKFRLITSACFTLSVLISTALPPGFKAVKFAGFPEITYPTGVAAAPTGEVYVCVDRNSSLDTAPGRGKIVRCVDTDGDGKADKFTDFVADIDSPRGSCFVGDTLYVVNPPFLTAFRDTDGDGVADDKRILIKGLGFDLSFRGADHTSNGVRMGIDGWLYLAIGDYGFFAAEGTDGSRLHLHGGGVARVRPDGSELEHYARYARNIYDVAVSPLLDVFARDNTNDGKGWNTRLHHFVPLADHGYPRLYKNFPNEHMQPLADYGGGSGTGGYWLDEPGFPAEYNNRLYTCDFTTRKVYQHSLEPTEATFKAGQKIFHDIQAIDLDADGQSRLYVSDWTGGAYRFAAEEVGAITRITYPDIPANKFPDLSASKAPALVHLLKSASAVVRLNASREIIRRGSEKRSTQLLSKLIGDSKAPLTARIAALFTLKQVNGSTANSRLAEATRDPAIREWALRALADRRNLTEGVEVNRFEAALADENPRVRLQAAIGLARLGDKSATHQLLALASDPDAGFSTEKDLAIKYASNQALPHTAIKAVVEMRAINECLSALDTEALRPAALRALQQLHDKKVVNTLIDRLEGASASEVDHRFGLLKALFRLYHIDKPWDGKKWWTTRPDDRGPYFEPVEWEMSAAIKPAIEAAFNAFGEESHSTLLYEMRRNRLNPADFNLNVKVDEVLAILESPAPGSASLPILEAAAIDRQRDIHTRVAAFQALGRIPGIDAFKTQLNVIDAWHEHEPAQTAFQHTIREFVFSAENLNRPKILRDTLKKPRGYGGQIVLMIAMNLANSPTSTDYLRNLLTPIVEGKSKTVEFVNSVGELMLTRYLPEIEAATSNPKTTKAAKPVLDRLRKLVNLTPEQKQSVEKLGVEKAVKLALTTQGDALLGNQIFARQSCLACHTVSQDAAQKGPYLGDAGKKWGRDYLVQSILQPSAVVAQGFQTQWFETVDEFEYDGFVTGEADGVVELRNAAGQIIQLKAKDIVKRGTRTASMMPEGLANNLTLFELASLLDYLQSMH